MLDDLDTIPPMNHVLVLLKYKPLPRSLMRMLPELFSAQKYFVVLKSLSLLSVQVLKSVTLYSATAKNLDFDSVDDDILPKPTN